MLSTYTIAQYVVIILGGIGYYFYRQAQKSPQRAKIQEKGKSLFDDASDSGKKKKSKPAASKDKKSKAAKASAPAVVVEKVQDAVSSISAAAEEKINKEELDSLQRLAGLKQNKGKKDKSAASKKDNKKSPASPAMGAISSTSSTTGADGDISEAFDDDVQAVSSSVNPAADMLEPATGPNVMRIKPSENAFQTVQRRSKTPTKDNEPMSKTQKKNAKKAEQRKQETAENRELQRERLEQHKRSQRLAREAEAAKHGGSGAAAAAPSSNAWAGGQSHSSTELLETFERSAGLSSSDIESHSQNGEDLQLSDDQRRDIPADVLAEYYAERRLSEPKEEQWIEVKKAKKEKKKEAVPAAAALAVANDSDSNRAPTPKGNEGRKFAEKSGFQDIEAPVFPTNTQTVSGWEAHAW